MGQQEAKPRRQESKPAKNATRRAKGTLTKEEVVREAMRLIEQEGVDACSMRNVATRVGVTAMALYSYVPSRDALLNEACVAFLSTVDARPRPGERWDDTLIRCMRALRNACMQHPRIAALTNDPAVGAGLEPYLMRLRALFLAQGMPEEIAIQLTVAADAFFAGFMLRSGQLVERVHDGDGSQAATGRKGRAGTGDASASTHSAAPAHPRACQACSPAAPIKRRRPFPTSIGVEPPPRAIRHPRSKTGSSSSRRACALASTPTRATGALRRRYVYRPRLMRVERRAPVAPECHAGYQCLRKVPSLSRRPTSLPSFMTTLSLPKNASRTS